MRKCMHFETDDYNGLFITTKTTMQKAVKPGLTSLGIPSLQTVHHTQTWAVLHYK